MIEPPVAKKIFDALSDRDVVTKSKLLTPISDDLKDKYQLTFHTIKEFTSARVGGGVSLADLFLAGLLPSREHFWRTLQKAEVLQSVQSLIIVDMKALKDKVDEKPKWIKTKALLDDLESKKTIKTNHFDGVHHSGAKENKQQPPNELKVCLYPELLDKESGKLAEGQMVLTEAEFKSAHGLLSGWHSLVSLNILQENSTGVLKMSAVNEKFLGSFDGLDTKTFFKTIDHMSLEDGKVIYNHLIDQVYLFH